MLARARPLLGTIVEIKVHAVTLAAEVAASDAAFATLEEIHRQMSFHDPYSDLSRINREAHLVATQVHTHLYAVLKRALEFSVLTGGLFDCTVGTRLMQLEYLPRTIDPDIRAKGSYRDIELLPFRHVRLRRPLSIDLGGIAKGYAVDKGITALQAHGAQAGLVNAGGDLRGFGDVDWPVSARHPRAPGQTVYLADIRNAAVATSADYYAARVHAGTTINPIINPHTQATNADAISVSVIAPNCMDADALTKVVWLSRAPPRSFTNRVRLARWHEYSMYAVVTLLALSGTVWLICRFFLAEPGQFGPMPHRWEGPMLKVHGAAAMLALFFAGSLLITHMLNAWNARRNRLSGGGMALSCLLLTVTGYGLYYIADDRLREVVSLAHWVPGVAMPLILGIHVYDGTRKPRSRLPRWRKPSTRIVAPHRDDRLAGDAVH